MAVWVVLLIKNVDIPCYFGSDWQFVGWMELVSFKNAVALFSGAMIFYALLSLVQLQHRSKGTPDSLKFRVSVVTCKNHVFIETLASIITVFSVIFMQIGSLRDFAVFVIVLAVISACFMMTNLYYSNPLLAILGYNLYTFKAVGTDIPDDSIAIFHGKLEDGMHVYRYHIADNVYYLI